MRPTDIAAGKKNNSLIYIIVMLWFSLFVNSPGNAGGTAIVIKSKLSTAILTPFTPRIICY
jgi:hypothetical protein